MVCLMPAAGQRPIRAVRVVPIAGPPLLVWPNERTIPILSSLKMSRERAHPFAREESRGVRDRRARLLVCRLARSTGCLTGQCLSGIGTWSNDASATLGHLGHQSNP